MLQIGINRLISYEELVNLVPDVDEYRLYYAQSLYKSGQYESAQKACSSCENQEFQERVNMF
jgi:tetratricopeptide repeat protein 30